jgi:hypothetical protein
LAVKVFYVALLRTLSLEPSATGMITYECSKGERGPTPECPLIFISCVL